VRGNLYAWGWNQQGEIGDGTRKPALKPAQVEVLHNVQFKAPTGKRPKRRYIDAGGSLPSNQGHSLALDSDGAVWAWGSNAFGQLGRGEPGNPDSTATPAKVSGLADAKVKVVDIAAGGGHSLALDDKGSVWAWGWNNVHQLGDNSAVNNATPRQVSSLERVKVAAVVAGGGHSLALDTDGAVWAWGWDYVCQLGNDSRSQYSGNSMAAKVSGLAGKKIVDIAAGGGHSLALDAEGVVWAWGWNNKHQLGDGNSASNNESACRNTVGIVSGLNVDVTSIAAGQGHSLALDRKGIVWAWGWNNVCQLGDGKNKDEYRPTAAEVSGLKNVVAISAGGGHSLALDDKGVVWAWGWNNVGQLGNDRSGDPTNSPQPTKVQGPLANVKVMAIDAGQGHSIVIV
jgi:alpha-tubulin suppressor-like RCC1 family protein